MSAEQVKELKVRIFDLSESLQERQEFESRFFSTLAEMLGIPEDQRSNPDIYLQAISDLKEKASLPEEDEIAE